MSSFHLLRPLEPPAMVAAPNRPADPSTSAPPSPPPKPKSAGAGVRILSLLIRVFVMVAALALFFLFAGFAALFLIQLCIAGRAFRRRRHRHPANPNSSAGAKAEGLSTADLRRLPRFRWPAVSAAAAPPWPPDFWCAVCLETVRGGDLCRALPECSHVFHATCVDRWLATCPACPLCRSSVQPPPPPLKAATFSWF